jgi:hypothetical protein
MVLAILTEHTGAERACARPPPMSSVIVLE